MVTRTVDKEITENQNAPQPASTNGRCPVTGHDGEQPERTFEFNFGDPHFWANAYATYAEMREAGPVVRVTFPRDEGEEEEQERNARNFFAKDAFFATRYEEVVEALLDERLSSDIRTGLSKEEAEDPTPEEFRPLSRSIILLDPPDHTRLRKLVQPGFTNRTMETLKPRIKEIADELLARAEQAAAERGETAPNRTMELVEDFAYPLPVTVISDLVGIPREDREMIRGWTENLLRIDRRRGRRLDEQSRAGLREFTAYLKELFERKRQAPADDLISDLVHAQEDGDKLDDDELLSMVFIVYLAGHVTTVNLIGNGTVLLLTHPEQLAKFKADPAELAKNVVEETLRYWGPVDFLGRRIAKEELELGGTEIPQGGQVMVGLGSANHDPARFANPDDYDITRTDVNRHVAFGKGIHVCLGAPLARAEGQVVFSTLFERLPDLRLAVPAEELTWGRSILRGFAQIPVLF